jgi:hypothetical protein
VKENYVSSNSAVEELYRHLFFSLYIYIYMYSEMSGSKTCQCGVNTLENFHVLSWFQFLLLEEISFICKSFFLQLIDFGFSYGYINIPIKTG